MARLSAVRTRMRRPAFIAALMVLLVLVGLRLALPALIERYANRVLNEIPGYAGHVDDVDLYLWRGGYTIRGLAIDRAGHRPVPVFHAPRTDLSIEWAELLRGAVVGEIEFYEPKINIFSGPVRKEEQHTADDFVQRLRELLPIRVNRFAVVDGEVHFRNAAAEPDVDLYLDRVNLVARNLTNSAKISDTLAATVSADGRAMKSGTFELSMRIDPFASRPTFELAFDLKNLRLPELNDYLRYYLAVVARDGLLSLYAESKAKDGGFRGYVKPFVKDLDVLHVKRDRSLSEAVKGFFVKLVAGVFENKPQEQLATKIEFSGSFENPETSVWEAVTTFLRNAFVQALQPGLEGSVAPGRAKRIEAGAPGGQSKAAKEERRTQKERESLEEKR